MPLGTEVGHIVWMGTNLPSPFQKEAQQPQIWPNSIVAKRSPISATAEHLSVSIFTTDRISKHYVEH